MTRKVTYMCEIRPTITELGKTSVGIDFHDGDKIIRSVQIGYLTYPRRQLGKGGFTAHLVDGTVLAGSPFASKSQAGEALRKHCDRASGHNAADDGKVRPGRIAISLTDAMRTWIDARVRGGEYTDPSDYVRDLIRSDRVSATS